MNKKALTEADIRTKFITPAILGASGDKWDVMTQVREEAYFTKGRVIVRGKTVKRGEAKKADYLLFFKPNIPLAVVEAKDNTHSVGAGMPQALEYAEILDVPFAYSSNGDAFLEHDRTVTSGTVSREIPLDQFPSPQELWQRYCKAKGWSDTQQQVNTQDYYDDGSGKSPRYYQHSAEGIPFAAEAERQESETVLQRFQRPRPHESADAPSDRSRLFRGLQGLRAVPEERVSPLLQRTSAQWEEAGSHVPATQNDQPCRNTRQVFHAVPGLE